MANRAANEFQALGSLRLGDSANIFTHYEAGLNQDGSRDVTIVVGNRPKPAIHQAHKIVLAQNSEYFKRLFYGSSGFKESAENEVVLSDHQPAVFNIVLHWLYNAKFFPNDRRDEWCKLTTAAKVFAEATYFGIPSLKVRAIQVLITKLEGETKRITYALGADLEHSFNQAIIQVFQLYPGEAHFIDELLTAIHANNMVKRVLQIPGMHNMILEEPSLAVKLLEVCFLEDSKDEYPASVSPNS